MASKLQKAVKGARRKPDKPAKKKRRQAEAEVVEDRPPTRSRARRARKPPQAPKMPAPAPEPPEPDEDDTEEPEAVQKARARLKKMVKTATGDAPPAAIGLVLAIVSQETGNHAAANALIDEYDLTDLFGIKKF